MDSSRDRSIMLEMARVWSRLAEYAAKTAARKECTEFICPTSVLTASELGEGQKSQSASGDARGEGGLGLAQNR
jgi:hypothetical protein